MTDRELLELAAKAAGMNMKAWKWYDGLAPHFHLMIDDMPTANTWNPLTDDGDALRLAVKLGLEVSMGAVGRHPETGEVFGMTYVTSADYDCLEKHSDDPYAATRRAIVRAAAEIGRTM